MFHCSVLIVVLLDCVWKCVQMYFEGGDCSATVVLFFELGLDFKISSVKDLKWYFDVCFSSLALKCNIGVSFICH